MERRQFLKMSAAGVTASLAPTIARSAPMTYRNMFELTIYSGHKELIDGTSVFGIFFMEGEVQPPPILRAREGEPIEIRIINRDARPHGFAITGIPGASIAYIPSGGVETARFVAPLGGSYLFHDPINAPTNRLLGLFGGFIVAPQYGKTPAGSPTPFSHNCQTTEVRALFDALGRTARFPGNQWDPNDDARDKVWIFSSIDPLLCQRVERGEDVTPASAYATCLPRYFQINGLSGFDTADHDEIEDDKHKAARAIMIRGRQGQPTLIRTMNAGIVTHSPHIHGNGVFDLTKQVGDTVVCSNNIFDLDAWTMAPLARKDMLLPLERPPDIPDAAWPPKQEPFPLRYVMHCHTEMSTTAGGGNYPQGMVSHWEMTGHL